MRGQSEVSVLPRHLSERVFLEEPGGPLHYLALVSRLRVLTEGITASREGDVRWFRVTDPPELRSTITPSDFLMLERFVFRRPRRVYYRCRITKVMGRYGILRFE